MSKKTNPGQMELGIPEEIDMKEGWQLKKLGEICDLQNGFAFKSNLFRDSGYPILRISNIQDEEIETRKVVFFQPKDYKENLDKYRVVNGDLLIAMSGATTGKIGFNTTDQVYYLNQRVGKFEPKDGLQKRFLFYFLSTREEENLRISAGAAQPNLSTEQIKDFDIPLPPLPEQKRIVGILDEAFEGIATAKANAEKNLQNARSIFESHLQSVFTQRGKGWIIRKVSEVAKHSLGKMLDKAKNKGKLQPYLRNINVRWFNIDLSDLLQMPFLPEESVKYTAVNGDVLICEGGYPGRAAIWTGNYPIYFQKALHRVRFHEPTYNKWFVYYLYAQDKSGQLKQHFNGAGIQHFTGEVLSLFEIPLPPLPELQQAVTRFDKLFIETQRLETIYQKKLDALEALKKSLLNQAFSGEL